MTRTLASAIVLPALVLAIATPVHAGGCGTVTTLELGVETIYIDDRSAESGNPEDIWIYMESNGVPGLQTGGWFPLYPDKDGTSMTINGLLTGYDPCYSGGPYQPDDRLRYSIL